MLLCMNKLNKVRSVDKQNASMVVEAGLSLLEAQEAAKRVDMLFPLSLASEGSAQVGGAISTNAGGMTVLKYGSMRDLVLGLEWVSADGVIHSSLSGLRKDNTGYALHSLITGSEGTLGVITAACLKLYPKPVDSQVALCSVTSVENAISLLELLRELDLPVSTFEFAHKTGVSLVPRHNPLGHSDNIWLVLLQVDGGSRVGSLRAPLEEALQRADEDGILDDCVLASDGAQAASLRALREGLSEATTRAGVSIKHDISVPIHKIPDFLRRADAAVARTYPGAIPIPFGHIGDGNIHYNVSQPGIPLPLPSVTGGGSEGVGHSVRQAINRDRQKWKEEGKKFQQARALINEVIYDIVVDMGGSISAEHGIGRLKVEQLEQYKDANDLNTMRAIKMAMDPHNILNSGRIINT